jgi:sugar/nucleoside kinase (ribokinase family)
LKRLDVLAVGDIAVDLLMEMESYPPPGSETVGYGAHLQAGGSPINTAVAAAALGLRAGVVGAVGSDALGDMVVSELEACSLDVSGVTRVSRSLTTLVVTVVTPGGQRTMFGYQGASSWLEPEFLPGQLIGSARLGHFSGYGLIKEPLRTAMEAAVRLCRSAGVAVSFDPSTEACCKMPQAVEALVPFSNLVLLSRAEALCLFGTDDPPQVAAELLARDVDWVALKMGEEGCWLSSRTQTTGRVPAFAVDVVDTTGAGDAFNAGVIYGYLSGMSLAASAVLGNAVGGLASTVWGVGRSLPRRDAVEALLRRALGEPRWARWTQAIMEALAAVAKEAV